MEDVFSYLMVSCHASIAEIPRNRKHHWSPDLGVIYATSSVLYRLLQFGTS